MLLLFLIFKMQKRYVCKLNFSSNNCKYFVFVLFYLCIQKGNKIICVFLFAVTETPPSIGEVSKIELLRSRLKTDIPLHDLESLSDTAVLAKNVCTIVDQIKHLRTAIENTIELSKIKNNKTDGSYDCKSKLFRK